MKEATIYETITNFLLDNWFISILVILIICISAIPPLRDGLVQIKNLIFTKKEFMIKTKDELVTFDYLKKTKHFDIVKIKSSTQELGVIAEYKWIRKYYPKHKITMQGLKSIRIDNKKIFYDVIEIELNNKIKSIYFDINEFFSENGSSLVDLDEFVISKIKELHIK